MDGRIVLKSSSYVYRAVRYISNLRIPLRLTMSQMSQDPLQIILRRNRTDWNFNPATAIRMDCVRKCNIRRSR